MRLAILGFTLLACAPAYAQAGADRLPACIACHGAGTSQTEGVPSLGGQPSDYLLVQLYLFREGQRVVAPMNAMAEGLTDDDLRTVSDAIAAQPPPAAAEPALDAAKVEHGRGLAAKYRCGSCHSPDYAGQGQIPRLAGQRQDYLVKSLTEYKTNARAAYDPAMNAVAQEISADDIPVLAEYLAHFRQ